MFDTQIINFLLRQGDGLTVGAYEACCTADVMDKMPAVIRKDHLHENVARKNLAFNGFFLAVGDLGDGFHRDVDFSYQIGHPAVFRSLHHGRGHCVFIT